VRLVVRRGAAAGVSAAAFCLSWWVCQGLADLDEGTSLALAGAVLAIVLAVAAWWAVREPPGSSADSGSQATQNVRAGRDAYTAGRDQTIVIRRRPDQ
jgi:hypothetical protein